MKAATSSFTKVFIEITHRLRVFASILSTLHHSGYKVDDEFFMFYLSLDTSPDVA